MSTKHKATEKPINLELKLSHEAMIACLTDDSLSDEAKIRRYAELAGFDAEATDLCLNRLLRGNVRPAYVVWKEGDYPKSLFGNMPGCCCPVIEARTRGAAFPGIPEDVGPWWEPTRATLEAFSRVQMEHRG